MPNYIKEIKILGSGDDWGLRGAQIIEVDETGVTLPARKLLKSDFPDVLGSALADTIVAVETLTTQLEEANQSITTKDTQISTLETQVASLTSQIEEMSGVNVPPSTDLSRRQVLLGLLKGGITESMVDAAIASLPDTTTEEATAKEIARIEWENAISYSRNHPLIAQLGMSFGLDDEQIDALWAYAQTV